MVDLHECIGRRKERCHTQDRVRGPVLPIDTAGKQGREESQAVTVKGAGLGGFCGFGKEVWRRGRKHSVPRKTRLV